MLDKKIYMFLMVISFMNEKGVLAGMAGVENKDIPPLPVCSGNAPLPR